MRLPTEYGQTDGQTPVKHNLLGGGNECVDFSFGTWKAVLARPRLLIDWLFDVVLRDNVQLTVGGANVKSNLLLKWLKQSDYSHQMQI